VSGLVLEHVRDIPTLFSQVHQVLRPGGRAVLSSFHPAMFLRESQARFTDPDSGVVIAPGSLPHSMSEFVMGAVQTGFTLKHIGEYSPDADFAASYPRCEKYIGYPMLVLLSLVKPAE
jgi:SAM-dependent methyltransferase